MVPMDTFDLFNGLNEKQREAVTAPRSNLLILAGAGSGKTRVLVHRIAWLLSVENCSPDSIMAVTFTKKAAEEMRQRIKYLIGTGQGDMWIGTFHGLAHRLLRTHYIEANLKRDFHILDSDDQMRLIKRIIKALNIDEKQWPAHQAMWYINGKKDEGLKPKQIETCSNSKEITWLRIYQAYQESCDRSGLLDFAELLVRAHALFLNTPHVFNYYHARFSNVLVDEFQDTNSIQYAWIRLMVGTNNNIMIVGDDDQSIYGWRGAQVENIQRFLKDFPKVKTLRLEQNYRSTSNILEAANTLIAHNNDRMKKSLWTEGERGTPIAIYCALTDLEEARFVIARIKNWQDNGGELSDCAILYRSNAQSRVLEETLLQSATPYRIYGGQRFFERQEIKDTLAYMRLISNRNDDTAFERVVNTPTRGIGERTIELVRKEARHRQLTLWETTRALLDEQAFPCRAASALKFFIKLVDLLSYETRDMPLYIQTKQVICDSGLFVMYQQDNTEKGRIRIENLKELVTATRQYNYQDADQGLTPLQAFLSHVALESVEDTGDAYQGAVQLMTLHAAKGLEFPLVFIVGMEEGMFPTQMSLNASERLEEERRLAYVGVTRAMKQLTLSYAEKRRLYGKQVCHQPSRFIDELPKYCVEKIQFRTVASSLMRRQPIRTSIIENNIGYKLGQRVRHHKFGEGTIVNLEGNHGQERLQIAFPRSGIKWLVVAYARLEMVRIGKCVK